MTCMKLHQIIVLFFEKTKEKTNNLFGCYAAEILPDCVISHNHDRTIIGRNEEK